MQTIVFSLVLMKVYVRVVLGADDLVGRKVLK